MSEQPAEQPEEWVSAASAVALLGMAHFLGTRTICKRAHVGLIKARAERFISDDQSQDNVDIPTEFWWAQGGAALHQNWTTGDFDTWIDHRIHLQAFGVTFRRSDIEGAKPTTVVEQTASIPSQTEPLKFSDVVTLKPTLWGMSIDLLKVWNWLQFPTMASILNRLWRDAVLSIVIATGITAGIGALVAWYFHPQTPPPATTPAPAILAAPPAVTQQPPQSPSAPALPNPSQTPVVWDQGSQFLIVTGGGPNAQINSVLLQGKITRSVSIKEAYAVSGLTGHRQ
jgi:hypothetical protein